VVLMVVAVAVEAIAVALLVTKAAPEVLVLFA
jgi:hypothetical protein